MEVQNAGVSPSQSVTASHQQHSQWLLIALAEAEESRKATLRILEGDGGGEKTLQVVQTLEELNERYCCLAHELDLLRSKLLYNYDGNIIRLAVDSESSQKKKLGNPHGESENQNASAVEIRVAELMQQNAQLQVELARRNDEKRDAIKGLQVEVERLKIENRSLQICARSSKIGLRRNRSQISRMAAPVLSKFFGRGTP